MLDQLTSEQISVIPAHVEKWRKIALSTERINKKQAVEIVNSVYEMLGYKSPTILFFDSPYEVCNFIKNQADYQLNNLFGKRREIDLRSPYKNVFLLK